MIQFKELGLSDKSVIESFTMKSKRMSCDISFSNLCSWKFQNNIHWAVVGGFLVFKFYNDDKPCYMMPIGEGDFVEVILLLEDDAQKQNMPFYISGISDEVKNRLEEVMPGKFKFRMNRDYFDYVYLRTDLATLMGAKLKAKRNHVNKFCKNYSYEYREITPELISQCLLLENEWCKRKNCSEDEALTDERKSIIYSLNHYRELGLYGGALFADGQMVAFAYGCPINDSVFDINVEKADSDIDGAYAMINHEFAKHIPEQYIYINREEDLGIEGLRKAKLSYHPVMMLEKGVAYIDND